MPAGKITTGRFSQLTYLSQKALRLYDSKGILVPGYKDRYTGYRYYTVDQIETALKIKMLCSLGFGLSEILEILSAVDAGDEDAVCRFIARRHRETMDEISRLENIESLLKKGRDFTELFRMNVSEPTIKDVAAVRVISGRRIGSYDDVCSGVAESLLKIIFSPENQRNNVKITGPFMTICYDGEYRENDADIEMAVLVSGRIVSDDPGYTVRTIPACRAVSVIYKGPYEHEGFMAAYENAYSFAAEKKLEVTGPDRQLYLNDPAETEPDDLLTEILIPVKE